MKKIIAILIITGLFFTSCEPKKKETVTVKENVAKTVVTEHISNVDFRSKIKGNKVQLVDVRTPGEYEVDHLENATLINYKDENFINNAIAKLDKSKPVYVYCHSGHRSANSAALLEKEGFTVYDMKGGISGWKENGFKTVTDSEIDKKVIKIDKKNSNVKPAINKPKPPKPSHNHNTYSVDDSNSNNNVNETVQVAGNVAITTPTNQQQNTVETVVESTTEPVTQVNETVQETVNEVAETVQETTGVVTQKPNLTPVIIRVGNDEFKAQINGKNVQLIDVRTPDEFNDTHIPKAKNINIYDANFVQQASVLDNSKPVYVYCRSGVRSMKAAKKLKNAGYKVYNLNDGIKGWQKAGNQVE
jgi:rhodanese-related sulfurtransferase